MPCSVIGARIAISLLSQKNWPGKLRNAYETLRYIKLYDMIYTASYIP